ncbi:adenosylcobinamide-phosphate synthase CbiB [Synechocystis salina]|uniref:Cobalamin biosynthesis protein CobD n=1 Tax=Synechocystis salina LEGE 00031 TaxID=1828736 RepID=A0ABR9VPY0_9SYNC|nr:adenosylcobinamide-phosphate synthase CbiB [Synechocystis salina]MBE9240224.1 cobalamin biosynthesis protein [Synechocystis salina LEGE 00041]MBE9253410.1 cobalamin biosynthesis protein [Synechocystis salina LEGE 00031]
MMVEELNLFPLNALVILGGSAWLDFLLGDPKSWLHPVQLIGWAINFASQLIIKKVTGKTAKRLWGIFLGLKIIIGSGFLAWLIVHLAEKFSPVLAIFIQIVGVASCFAGHSLAQAARSVIEPLKMRDLSTAQQKLALFVGRDTDNLSETEILRATVESVAENTVDGVTAPLFYALLGLAMPFIGPWPLAIAYKAASTLDSMVGYKREPYTDLGWFSARLEDYLTWLPCRLTVLMLALLSKKPRHILAMARRDGPLDPSPNSGWSEAIYAAILGVQLGGDNYYQGVLKSKPLLGDAVQPLTIGKISQGLWYSRTVFLWQLLLGLMIILAIQAGAMP